MCLKALDQNIYTEMYPCLSYARTKAIMVMETVSHKRHILSCNTTVTRIQYKLSQGIVSKIIV